MQLQLNQNSGMLLVQRVDDAAITVGDVPRTTSFVLLPGRILEGWFDGVIASLAPEHATPIIALEPAVVLLATGARQVFPPAAFTAAFLTRGIGLEVMDTRAAARTYNVLASEDRNVAVAFWFPRTGF